MLHIYSLFWYYIVLWQFTIIWKKKVLLPFPFNTNWSANQFAMKNVFKHFEIRKKNHFEIRKKNCKQVLTVPQWSSATEGYTVARYNSSTIALHWPMSCELALSFWHFYFSGKCNTILILNPTGERQQKQVVVFYLFCSRIMSRWHQVLIHHKQIINKR